MQTCWVVLLLPLLGAASTELPTTGTVPPQPTPSYAQALATAVNVYNQGSGVDIAFRVLEAESRDDWVSIGAPGGLLVENRLLDITKHRAPSFSSSPSEQEAKSTGLLQRPSFVGRPGTAAWPIFGGRIPCRGCLNGFRYGISGPERGLRGRPSLPGARPLPMHGRKDSWDPLDGLHRLLTRTLKRQGVFGGWSLSFSHRLHRRDR
uniref:DOMON domain-containing protein n=1 Tax=Crocodylus porosus TaxID=8502 RepID=A0A7M4E4N8_CROPO